MSKILILESVSNRFLKIFLFSSVEQSSTIIISIFLKDWFWILLIDFINIYDLLYVGRTRDINGLLSYSIFYEFINFSSRHKLAKSI